MIDLKRILVPTDFSEYSQVAVRYGCEFARRFDAELHLLHVLQDIVALVPEPGLTFPPPGDYVKDLRDSAQVALEKLPGKDVDLPTKVVRELRDGPAFVEIIRYAKANKIDLIVLGTHGRSGLAHMLMGSVAERVVRKASCPVLSVRHPEHEFVMP